MPEENPIGDNPLGQEAVGPLGQEAVGPQIPRTEFFESAESLPVGPRATRSDEVFESVVELFTRANVGESAAEWLAHGALFLLLIVLSIVVHFVAKRVLLRAVRTLISRSRAKWDDLLVEAKVFDRLAQFAPALVVYSAAGIVFAGWPHIITLVSRVSLGYMVLLGARVIAATLDAFVYVYRTFDVSKNRPMKGFAQVAKIFVTLIAGIVILGILMDQSPWGLLSGLGAMTAIILLVFKDSILGFVAGIHLTANNMVRLGDWIEMPRFNADGDVIDISLTTVKVQNWDKTISTIPTYALISDSFKNWRGMEESTGRRVKRAIRIDMNSVRFCDEAMLERFRKLELLSDYVAEKEREIEEYNAERSVDPVSLANGRRMTNLGTFRRYTLEYVRRHAKINGDMTLLVRHLAPTSQGLPIEIYAFSTDKRWVEYEDVQADIFDHLLAALPEFDLRVFQEPCGSDVERAIAELAGGRE